LSSSTAWYDQLEHDLQRILREAFAHGRERYLERLLAAGEAREAFALTGELGSALRVQPEWDGEAAAALEQLVRAIATNRRELLVHRTVVPGLRAAVKDPWRLGPLPIDESALLNLLPASETRSIRLDRALRVDFATDGSLGRAARQGDELVFTRGRKITARVNGPAERLALVETAVAGETQLLAEGLSGLLMPRDAAAFASVVAERTATVDRLMRAGRTLVEAAERLVCALYSVPSDLEDAVVEHACQRAAPGE